MFSSVGAAIFILSNQNNFTMIIFTPAFIKNIKNIF